MTPQRFNGGEPRRAEGFLIKYNTFDMGFIRVTILARSFAVVAGLLAVAWSAIPVSAQDSRPGRTRPVPFRVGERLTYDVKWSSFLVRVTAGTVTMDITGRRPSPEDLVYAVVAEARLTRTLSKLYSLYYRAETLIDAETLLPRRGSIHTEEGKRRRTKLTRFDQLAHRAEYEIRTATVVTQELTVPAGVQDALSALYALRAMPWKSGEAFSIPVSDSGKIYTVHVAVGESERVKTGLGTLSALQASLRVVEEGVGPLDRRMDLWVSDDSRRLPVKVQIDLPVGSFVLLLKQVS